MANTDPFLNPSEASSGDGVSIQEFEGSLIVMTKTGDGEYESQYPDAKTGSKMRPYVAVTVDVIEGVADGTVSKMPPPAARYEDGPRKLTDRTGETHEDVWLMQAWLYRVFRNKPIGTMALGTLVVQKLARKGETTKTPTWIFEDATDDERAQAVEWLNRKQSDSLGRVAVEDDEPEEDPRAARASRKAEAPASGPTITVSKAEREPRNRSARASKVTEVGDDGEDDAPSF